jgi:hypothetical protein
MGCLPPHLLHPGRNTDRGVSQPYKASLKLPPSARFLGKAR